MKPDLLGLVIRHDQPPNPNRASEMHLKSIQWVTVFGVIEGKEAKKLEASRIGEFIANAFHGAGNSTNLDALQLAVDWTTWFLCLDDALEQMKGIGTVRRYLARLLGVFDEDSPELLDPLGHALFDIRSRMSNVFNEDQMSRFTTEVSALFEAFSKEAEYRINNKPPTLETYLKIREHTVGLRTGFLLWEAIQALELHPSIFNHPILKEMAKECCLAVGLHNDLHTYERELRNDEVNNAVIILIKQGYTAEEAEKEIARLHNEKIVHIMHLASQLSDSEPGRQRVYIDILLSFVASHHEWAQQTERYDQPNPSPHSDSSVVA